MQSFALGSFRNLLNWDAPFWGFEGLSLFEARSLEVASLFRGEVLWGCFFARGEVLRSSSLQRGILMWLHSYLLFLMKEISKAKKGWDNFVFHLHAVNGGIVASMCISFSHFNYLACCLVSFILISPLVSLFGSSTLFIWYNTCELSK